MNLVLRGIDGSQVKWNNEGSFPKDDQRDYRADFILANPPITNSVSSGQLLRKDPRRQFGVPPTDNANYAWMQYIIYDLPPMGIIGLVLATGSLSRNASGEGVIRKNVISVDLIDCIVALR